MLKALALTFAAGLVSAMLVAPVSAMPLSHGKAANAIEGSDVTQVRDGCGRGMRWSERRDRCVPQRDADPIRPLIRQLVNPDRGCGRGWRWSERRGRCVRD